MVNVDADVSPFGLSNSPRFTALLHFLPPHPSSLTTHHTFCNPTTTPSAFFLSADNLTLFLARIVVVNSLFFFFVLYFFPFSFAVCGCPVLVLLAPRLSGRYKTRYIPFIATIDRYRLHMPCDALSMGSTSSSFFSSLGPHICSVPSKSSPLADWILQLVLLYS